MSSTRAINLTRETKPVFRGVGGNHAIIFVRSLVDVRGRRTERRDWERFVKNGRVLLCAVCVYLST